MTEKNQSRHRVWDPQEESQSVLASIDKQDRVQKLERQKLENKKKEKGIWQAHKYRNRKSISHTMNDADARTYKANHNN